MADDVRKLQDGLYEKVISEEFSKKLIEALEEKRIWVEREEVDAHEATRYLSAYLQGVVALCLRDIADENGEDVLSDEVTFINGLIDRIKERIPVVGEGHKVVPHEFLLKSLEHRANKIEQKKWERPVTSLTNSYLFTNSQKDSSIGSELKKEIMSADRIDFLVSFIKCSGLNLLLPFLREFTDKGGKLRVITTTYMGATDPKAIEALSSLANTEIRISYDVKATRLHAKSYIFHRNSGYSTAYVGSSNLSHAAIADGLEWNMKVTAKDMPRIMEKINATFEIYWNAEEFEKFHPNDVSRLQEEIDCQRGRGQDDKKVTYLFDIRPYPYQQIILDALETERKQKGGWQNLVVAATGTGKTAIAAFDYRRFARERLPKPTKLLFVAHREEILKQSQACFRQVMKNADFGELAVGGSSFDRTEHLFMSIQTLNNQRLWEKMDPNYYDMIVVDEFHHAAAKSYQKLLEHFKPAVLLGLTATPERMDGKSVLTYFKDRISAEIRLPDAIERRLLCPFHYFGVADSISLKDVTWKAGHYDTEELTNLYTLESYGANKRADIILDAVERYTADMRDVKGLGFCVSQRHAAFMADYMNSRNIPSMALDSNSSKEDRDMAKHRLETGKLTFLFTVDLFNEGVDIPAVNTVLFLRPTNSMTVFIQQLGRGLRLHKDKDCLTVLDFVAQANKKYNFTDRFTAMLGKSDVSIKKEIEMAFPHVPKGCSIQLEKVAQENILENIRQQLSRYDYYKECLKDLWAISGEVPTIAEFLKAAHVQPSVFYNGKRTYARLCADAGIIPSFEETEEEIILQKAIPRMLSIDSVDWISFLERLFNNARVQTEPMTTIEKKYLRMWQWTVWGKDFQEAGMKTPTEAISRFKKIKGFQKELTDLLRWQKDRVEIISQKVKVPYVCPLDVYCNYSRDQIFAGLGFEKPSSIREGVKFLDKKNSDVTKETDVFLVTLNKSEKEFSDTTLYEDYSINKELFHWQSQSTTSDTSKTGIRYRKQNETGGIVLLFVRKSKKDAFGKSLPYTFLGTAHFMSYEGSQPMSIIYKLDHPIPAKYIQTTDTAGVL